MSNFHTKEREHTKTGSRDIENSKITVTPFMNTNLILIGAMSKEEGRKKIVSNLLTHLIKFSKG